MSRRTRGWWYLWIGRRLTLGLPARVALGPRGRRLTISRGGVTVRVGRGATALTWTWRSARRRPRAAPKRRGR